MEISRICKIKWGGKKFNRRWNLILFSCLVTARDRTFDSGVRPKKRGPNHLLLGPWFEGPATCTVIFPVDLPIDTIYGGLTLLD